MTSKLAQAHLGRLLTELNLYLLQRDWLSSAEFDRACDRLNVQYLALVRAQGNQLALHHPRAPRDAR